MHVTRDPKSDGITPYTTATALSSGWVWNIPLFNRIGTGYVYSSAFRTPEEAEQELRSFLGKRSENCHASHIRMRVGRNRNSWVGNCVAIGLSSGFVEPLESTGIFFIQHAVEQLVSYFPGTSPVEENVRSYNRVIGNCIDGVREFLTLHYVASSRADTPFWKATKTDIRIPAELAERMKLWKMRLPTNTTINPNYHGFEAYSYSVMLLGLGHRPEQSLPILNHVCEKRALAALEAIRQRSQHLASTLPSAYEYLCHQHQAMAASVPA
jgi:tryptophan halogenase